MLELELRISFVFRKNSKANEMALFTCLHDTGINASVTRISSNKQSFDEECVMIQDLKQVVKETKFLRGLRDRFATLPGIQYGRFSVKKIMNFKLLTIIAKT